MPTQGIIGEPYWSDDELENDRQFSIQRFIDERLDEYRQPYVAIFQNYKERVRKLLDETDDLQNLEPDTFLKQPELAEPARYIGSPPVSKDDLETLSGGSVFVKNIDEEVAEEMCEVLESVSDPYRFEWLEENRNPEEHEKEKAIEWTAGLWCVQQVRTQRRTESSQEQENAAKEFLRSQGLEEHNIKRLNEIDELPVGQFSGETDIGGSKCDIPIRVTEEKLLAIECKVSNSEVNSIKRLLHEVGDKKEDWKSELGEDVITAALLKGVFKQKHLKQAQEKGITIFWTHDLEKFRLVEGIPPE